MKFFKNIFIVLICLFCANISIADEVAWCVDVFNELDASRIPQKCEEGQGIYVTSKIEILECGVCPAGTYSAVVNVNDSSINIPKKTITNINDFTTLNSFFSKYYIDITAITDCSYRACIKCPEEKNVSLDGATECMESCPQGYQKKEISSYFKCEACGAGYYSVNGEDCQSCDSGLYSAEGAGECGQNCPSGYEKKLGTKECVKCGEGKYSDGSSACQSCPNGSVAAADGTSCKIQCDAGTYKKGNTCELCPVGTYSDGIGAESCTPCKAGTYADKTGSTECTPCPKGYYASGANAAECLPCPAHTHASNEGSEKCDLCLGAYTSSTGNAECVYKAGTCVINVMEFRDGNKTVILGGSSTSYENIQTIEQLENSSKAVQVQYGTETVDMTGSDLYKILVSGDDDKTVKCAKGTYHSKGGSACGSEDDPGLELVKDDNNTFKTFYGKCKECKMGTTTANPGSTSPNSCTEKLPLKFKLSGNDNWSFTWPSFMDF